MNDIIKDIIAKRDKSYKSPSPYQRIKGIIKDFIVTAFQFLFYIVLGSAIAAIFGYGLLRLAGEH